jgi:7-keto-8-aminopelargonate synthetase-like enzyme
MLDEAHATGVLGPSGRGLAAREGITPDVHVGTLSKGIGTFGGYVAASGTLAEWLLNKARSFVFTTALPPMVVVATEVALDIVQGAEGAERRGCLLELVRHFREGLSELGLLAERAGQTPIFPVLIGDSERAMAAAEALLRCGIYAQGIRPPTVPRGTARLRFALSAAHQFDDLDRALAGLRACRDEGLIGPWTRTRSTGL